MRIATTTQMRQDSIMLIYAELSANHAQQESLAFELIDAAARSGADGIKVQTYTPDTITLNAKTAPFIIQDQPLWKGQNLWDLYQKAYTPWEWQPRLKQHAESLGLRFAASVFDSSSVDFWEAHGLETYKIASAELIDIPLLTKVASTHKEIILSTGMATLSEIEEAVATIYSANPAATLTLLRCSSAYPAPASSMNLRAIQTLIERFKVPVGLSDHSTDDAMAVCAVGLGATVFEKHIRLENGPSTPDDAFSLTPDQFAGWAAAIHRAKDAMGDGECKPSPEELVTLPFRRSLFTVKAIRAGEPFTRENIRSIRPATGLHPREYEKLLSRKASCDIPEATPLSWDLVE